jgi:hypothetical protein
MGLEFPAASNSADNSQLLQHNADVAKVLPLMQPDSGEKYGIGRPFFAHHGMDKPDFLDAPAGPIKGLTAVELTDKDRSQAETSMARGISKLIPEADRESLKAMTSAITSGDSHAFAEAVKKAGADPERLKKLVTEVNKMLEAKHSSTHLDVTGDGKVLLSDANKDTALAFNPVNGNIEGREVHYGPNGMTVTPGELLHVDVEQEFKQLSDQAVASINGNDGAPGSILGLIKYSRDRLNLMEDTFFNPAHLGTAIQK